MPTGPAETDARSLLRAEGPRAALERLKQEVRKAPRDSRLRVFLFQLFCVFAEWDRALNQLTVAAELDPLALPMAQAYRAAIRCEMLRERVFAGARSPTVLGAPAPWMSQLIEANRVLATAGAGAAAFQRAADLRDEAFEAAPASSGSYVTDAPENAVLETKFSWIADSDQRLGPMLEAFIDGKYYWVPFTRLARLDIEAPADLRDHVWMPAHFTWANGGEADGFIPTRYPGSAAADDEALAWSRRTEWRAPALSAPGAGEAGAGEEWYLGLGQRMFSTDADEVALMDLRRLDLAVPDPSPPPDLSPPGSDADPAPPA